MLILGAAYSSLFRYEGTNALFAPAHSEPRRKSDPASKNIEVLRTCLESSDVIVIGYGGWNDGLMAALRQCDSGKHTVYWCDVRSRPASHIANFISGRDGDAVYVPLGEGGANDLMHALYDKLMPADPDDALLGSSEQ